MPHALPRYTRAERLADGCVHVTGVAFSLLATAAMMTVAARALPAASTVSLGVYAFGMVAVFACSAAYHLATRPGLKAILRRFDHAAIYVKIAGTYTPLAFVKMGDAVGFALLGAVWAITNLYCAPVPFRIDGGMQSERGCTKHSKCHRLASSAGNLVFRRGSNDLTAIAVRNDDASVLR
jgi:Haemolysin-III related